MQSACTTRFASLARRCSMHPMIHDSDRLTRAFAFAARHHAGQKRKASQAPLVHHPIATASLVLQYGGSEAQAAAALLHDTEAPQEELEREFGPEIARLVSAFTQPLAEAPTDALLVIACEELHDTRELIHDLRHYGLRVQDRHPAVDVPARLRAMLPVFEKKLGNRALLSEFREAILALEKLA